MNKLSAEETRNVQDPGMARISALMPVDQRLLPRQRSVLRVARVSSESEGGFARVINISDEGLMLAIQLSTQPGSVLQIDLSETIRLRGEVIWSNGHNCGVKLIDPIDSAATLARLLADSVKGRERALRLPCSSEAIAVGEFGSCKVQVDDVSLRGMKVRHDGTFKEGLRVKILLGTIQERTGVVRWCRDGRAGVAMVEPFSVGDLGSTGSIGSRSD